MPDPGGASPASLRLRLSIVRASGQAARSGDLVVPALLAGVRSAVRVAVDRRLGAGGGRSRRRALAPDRGVTGATEEVAGDANSVYPMPGCDGARPAPTKRHNDTLTPGHLLTGGP